LCGLPPGDAAQIFQNLDLLGDESHRSLWIEPDRELADLNDHFVPQRIHGYGQAYGGAYG
jgi:hypothetical protein